MIISCKVGVGVVVAWVCVKKSAITSDLKEKSMQQQYAFRYLNSQSATNYYSTRIEDYLISMFTCTFFFSAVVTMMVVMM
jgi:hypothetical protein